VFMICLNQRQPFGKSYDRFLESHWERKEALLDYICSKPVSQPDIDNLIARTQRTFCGISFSSTIEMCARLHATDLTVM
jgi:hypothetical protein